MRIVRHSIAILTAALLWGCSGESYPGLEYTRESGGEAHNEEGSDNPGLGMPVLVFASQQSFFTATAEATRGAGAFDTPSENRADSNRYEKSLFYIYAFRDTPDDAGPLTYKPDFSRRSSDTGDANANCLIDGPDFLLGMPAHLAKERTGEFKMLRSDLRRDTTMTYSDRFADIGYNFFAYYIDDFVPTSANAHRSSEEVVYNIDIDGARDIMFGHSRPLTPAELDSSYAHIELTEEQRNKVLNIGNYSNFASYMGINPVVEMRHAMTRLRFLAYPADISADDVTITGIDIFARKEAQLRVAAYDLRDVEILFSEERDTIRLGEADPTKTLPDSVGLYPYGPLSPEYNTVHWDPSFADRPWTENPPLRIGGDLLVAPDTTYVMVLHYCQNLDRGRKRYLLGKFTINAPRIPLNYDAETDTYWYQPGYIYNIRIGVYGMRPVVINVEGDHWIEGEEIEIPPD